MAYNKRFYNQRFLLVQRGGTHGIFDRQLHKDVKLNANRYVRSIYSGIHRLLDDLNMVKAKNLGYDGIESRSSYRL